MDLDTYLRENGIEGASFAARIGLTEASLSRIRRGQQNITRDTMRRIFEASDGAVTLESMVFPAVHAGADTANLEAMSPGKAGDNFPAAEAAE